MGFIDRLSPARAPPKRQANIVQRKPSASSNATGAYLSRDCLPPLKLYIFDPTIAARGDSS
jgi:hypothetical protein